jgi:hypothetical protein
VDKKSKIFFIILFLLIAGSIAVTYWRIMIKKDYMVESQIDCDPETEACFIWECDPESSVEGEACTGDPEEDVWYYKIARRNASMIPLCDPEADETCDPWSCGPAEKDCSETLCDETTRAEQETECNDPAEYLLNNPSEEELDEEECEEGDEECLAVEEIACEEGDEECAEENEEEIMDEEGDLSAEDAEITDEGITAPEEEL